MAGAPPSPSAFNPVAESDSDTIEEDDDEEEYEKDGAGNSCRWVRWIAASIIVIGILLLIGISTHGSWMAKSTDFPSSSVRELAPLKKNIREGVAIHSNYIRPKFEANLQMSVFHNNLDCERPPCSEQVHIQLGGPGEMVISYASSLMDDDTEALVSYGLVDDEGLPHVATGTTSHYSQLYYWKHDLWEPKVGKPGLTAAEIAALSDTSSWAYDNDSQIESPAYKKVCAENVTEGIGSYDNPAEHYHSPLIHTVVLRGLSDKKKYKYKVSNDNRIFSFTMTDQGLTFPYKIGLASDIGQTAASNATLAILKDIDPAVVLISGDLSYADGYYPRWDTYGRLVERLGAYTPMMSCPGNHEVAAGEQYVSYNARYPMPASASGSRDNAYWSRDMGPVHVIALNSYSGFEPSSLQYKWLVKDLRKIDRKRTPWIFVLMHVPWYNSNFGHWGEGKLMKMSMETLLYEAGVNAIIAGHVHSFERTLPMYQNKTNLCGPTYLNMGDAGNREGPYSMWMPGLNDTVRPAWTAFREGSFGAGELIVKNATHVQFFWHRHSCYNASSENRLNFSIACSTEGDPSIDAKKHIDSAWIIRPADCANQW